MGEGGWSTGREEKSWIRVLKALEGPDSMQVQAIDSWTAGLAVPSTLACQGENRTAHSPRRGSCLETTGRGQDAVVESRDHSWA